MKSKIKYTDENLGDGVKVVDDFLPPPTQFVLKKENHAVTEQSLNINLPEWMLQLLDNKALHLGVSRESLIKFWLSEKLSVA